jgi:hypothetical protein
MPPTRPPSILVLHPWEPHMKRTALGGALTTLLLLAACGGGEDEQAKAAISEQLMTQQQDQQMVELEQEEADCISEGMVDGIGVDQLKEYGFLDEDGTVNEDASTTTMSKEDARILVDSMFDCTDVMATMQEELAATMGQQTPEMRQCIEEALTEERVRKLLEATFAGEQQGTQELMAPLMQCAMLGSGAPQSPN